jgi:hypothetical protein
MTTLSASASVAQILLWYDRPEIVLLKVNLAEFILAVSSGSDDEGEEDVYVGASMNLTYLAEYQDGKFDLRYALAHANLRRYWTFNFTGHENAVDLKKVKKSSDIVANSLPDAGFFSREHHVIKAVAQFVPDAVEKFDIDGSWELGEFSRFYGQVEDIYYIFNDIRRFSHPSTSAQTKLAISNALDRPWRGGGSYVGYYDKIANDNAPTAKLRVSGIQYNSPGYVSLHTKKRPFDDIIALLQAYAHNMPEMRKAHNVLYRFMSHNKLLKADSANFVSAPIRNSVEDYALRLDAHMPGVSYETFRSMANGSEVVAAKVLLSVWRRMDRLYKYFEEGRVKYEGLETDPMMDMDR